MSLATEFFPTLIEYPEADGLPMAESDQTRDYLVYATKVLSVFFQDRAYVSGNLFIYYEQGNPESVVAPDVFRMRRKLRLGKRRKNVL